MRERGSPGRVVTDSPRADIPRAYLHEMLARRTNADMTAHDGSAVIPARPCKPRDKAKVEAGVQVVQRWTRARLRDWRKIRTAWRRIAREPSPSAIPWRNGQRS
ncbi:MAG: hypothetical protein AB7S57_14390 [Acetobacteraceae bacterium]